MIETSSTVIITPLDSNHLDRTLEWFNDNELRIQLNRARPISRFEHLSWFEKLNSGQKNLESIFFAIQFDDLHVGNIWLADIDWINRKAEVRIVIGNRDYLEKGIGVHSINLISDFAFRKFNLRKLIAQVLCTNPRAKRAFEKAGFRLESIFIKDRWSETDFIDVWQLSLFREENV